MSVTVLLEEGILKIYQFSHQASRREVALQEYYEVPPGQEDTTAKYHRGWDGSHGFVEGVEACRWQNEPSDYREV